MMRQIRNVVVSVALLQLAAQGAWSQQPRGRGGFGIPDVGTPLPSVTVYDENGDEFSLEALRGHYSVLVFGCLT